MSISFVPSLTREVQAEGMPDLRITCVINHSQGTSRQSKNIGIDMRLHPRVVEAFGLSHGDRVIGLYELDGSWTVTKVDPGQAGYSVRCGGSRSKRGNRIHGRIGFLYFRFSCTKAQAKAIFGDKKHIDCDLLDANGKHAMFVPSVSVRAVEFVPAS